MELVAKNDPRLAELLREQIDIARDAFHEYYAQAGIDSINTPPFPKFEWAFRFRTRAGSYHTNIHTIRLNPHFYINVAREEQHITTLHELAHAIDRLDNGRICGHGRPWKTIMRRLGLRPDVYHSQHHAVKPNKKHYVKLGCNCCGEVYKLRQRKYRRECSYQCPKTGCSGEAGRLVYLGAERM